MVVQITKKIRYPGQPGFNYGEYVAPASAQPEIDIPMPEDYVGTTEEETDPEELLAGPYVNKSKPAPVPAKTGVTKKVAKKKNKFSEAEKKWKSGNIADVEEMVKVAPYPTITNEAGEKITNRLDLLNDAQYDFYTGEKAKWDSTRGLPVMKQKDKKKVTEQMARRVSGTEKPEMEKGKGFVPIRSDLQAFKGIDTDVQFPGAGVIGQITPAPESTPPPLTLPPAPPMTTGKQDTPPVLKKETATGPSGSVMSIPLDTKRFEEENQQSVEQKVGAGQTEALDAAALAKQELLGGKKRAGDVDTAFGSDIDRLGQRKDLSQQYNMDLAQNLINYTKEMDTNQEIDFWNKIIGGLGRVVAGGTGLGMDLDVGGKYKEPTFTTAAELAKTTQPQYDLQKQTLEDTYKQDTGVLDVVEKYKRGEELNMKDITQLINALNRIPGYTTTKQSSKQTGTEETKEQGFQLGYPPKEGETERRTDQLETKQYSALVAPAVQQFNTLQGNVLRLRDDLAPQEFGKAFAGALNTWGSGKGITLPKADKIAQAYDSLLKSGMNPAQARQHIVNDFKSTLMLKPAQSDTAQSFEERGDMYGLPFKFLNSKKGLANPLSVLFTDTPATPVTPATPSTPTTPAAPSVGQAPTTPVAPAMITDKKSTDVIKVRNKITGKTGDITVKQFNDGIKSGKPFNLELVQ